MQDASGLQHSRLFKYLLIAALLVLPMLRVGYFGVPLFLDDTGIVFVYALNLLNHGSIFFNVPADRLDGFTSMTDVLFAVPLAALSPESLFELNYYVKAFVTSLVPLAVYGVLRQQHVPVVTAGIAALAVAVSAPLAHGFGMQLEAPYYALFMCAFIAALITESPRRPLWLILTAALLTLTRPEAPAFVIAGLLTHLFLFRKDQTLRKQTLLAFTGFLLFLAAWYSWRIYYFGYWAPNTYYAKLSGTRLEEIEQGISFVLRYFSSSPDVWLCFAAFVSIAALGWVWVSKNGGSRAENTPNKALTVGVIALAMLAVRIATGGDSYTISARLLIDFFIPAALATGLAINAFSNRRLAFAVLLIAALSVLGNGFNMAMALPENLTGFVRMERKNHSMINCERAAIQALHSSNPDARFAQTDFQRAKYYAPNMYMIDLSGLNNREIAHRKDGESNVYGKHDLEYGLSQEAEIWKLGTGPTEYDLVTPAQWEELLQTGKGPEMRTPVQFFIDNADVLRNNYRPVAIKTSCNTYMNLIVTKDIVVPATTQPDRD